MNALLHPARFLAAAVLAIAGIVPLVATVVTTDLFIVREEEPITEDVYVAAQSAVVEGLVDGDLSIVSGDLTISGTVTGTVSAISSGVVRIAEGGSVGGSLRATAREVVVDGSVGDDVLAVAVSTSVGSTGSAGRDLIVFGGGTTIAGSVGRDVRGRVVTIDVSGEVGRDVDVTVSRIAVQDGARIGGDILYRSAGEADIADGAQVDGEIVQLPSSPNFLYGVILSIANVVSLLAFVLIGIVFLWLFRNTSTRSVYAVTRKPVRSLLVGLAAVVLVPIAIVFLAVTLVGIPLALALLVLLIVALVAGPVPFVTGVADTATRGRLGLIGAFTLGAVVFRLGIWFIPWVGGFLFVLGLVWGVGAWIVGAWEQRRVGGPAAGDLLPPAMVVREDDAAASFEFPLPPSARSTPPEEPSPEVPDSMEAAQTGEGGAPEAGEVASDATDDLVAPAVDEPAAEPPEPWRPPPRQPPAEDDWGLPRH